MLANWLGIGSATNHAKNEQDFVFRVFINKGELNQIHKWVREHNNIETGGDLFGLWIDERTAVVQFVLGPGKNCNRDSTSFFQDVSYLRNAGSYLTKAHGLCNIGQWHSHHRIRLFKPSAGDDNTVWNNMPGLGLDRYIVFIANITNTVEVNCFLYQIKDGRELPVKSGEFHELDANSPFRLNENVLQNIHQGAERLNQIAKYEKENCYYIVDQHSKENETRNCAENDGNGASVKVVNSGEKNANQYTPDHMFSKSRLRGGSSNCVVPVRNESEPVRHDQSIRRPLTNSPCNNEELFFNRPKEKGILVKVETYHVPMKSAHLIDSAKNHEGSVINQPVEVRHNFDNQKHNQNEVQNKYVLPNHEKSICSTANTTSQQSGKREKRQSDMNQINDASNRIVANACSEGRNYKLVVSTPTKTVEQECMQDTHKENGKTGSSDQQTNVGQTSYEHHEATPTTQRKQTSQVTHISGTYQTSQNQSDAAITEEPPRSSWYDNVKNEPEDVDQTVDIKQSNPKEACQQSRPITNSGTMLPNTSENAVKDVNDETNKPRGLFSTCTWCSCRN